jgi:MFS superfamily sulfate permease-like transporter
LVFLASDIPGRADDGRKQQILRFYFLGKDFGVSIVVLLVALPLCMGIAIASGVPPDAGLISGIIGGIVVALLAGLHCW